MGVHPKHPRCPHCKKAMYKTMIKAKWVKKSDPWAFCRNLMCEEYGENQSGLPTADGFGREISKRVSRAVKPSKAEVKRRLYEDMEKAKIKESKKIAAIKVSILSGKYSEAEIIFNHKTTRRLVSKVFRQLREEGKI